MEDPKNSWTAPFVTGHTYKMHIGTGVDFEELQAQLSVKWEASDLGIKFVSNFTDQRARINVTTTDKYGVHDELHTAHLNYSLRSVFTANQMGNNLVLNETQYDDT